MQGGERKNQEKYGAATFPCNCTWLSPVRGRFARRSPPAPRLDKDVNLNTIKAGQV